MKVADLMRKDMKTVDINTTIGDAITTLAAEHVSPLPVTDARGQVVGVLSTTDILWALSETPDPVARERLLDDTPVRDVMMPCSRVMAPNAEIPQAARDMLDLDVDRVFVEDDGRLVGVISQTDIVAAVARRRYNLAGSCRSLSRATLQRVEPEPRAGQGAHAATGDPEG